MNIHSKICKSGKITTDIKSGYYTTPYHKYPSGCLIPPSKTDYAGSPEDFKAKMKEYEEEVEKRKVQIELFKHDRACLLEEFHDDLKKEFGTESNPKESMLFDIARSHGGDCSLYKIYKWYAELSKLIK